METPPLLNEKTEEATLYDRFSKILFNNRLGVNPSVMIVKDRVAIVDGKELHHSSRPYTLAVGEDNKDETIEFLGQQYSYEWVYGFMNALAMTVIDRIDNPAIIHPNPEEEEPEIPVGHEHEHPAEEP